MSASEAVQASHLERLALVYVRQSSPHQVLMNQESLKLQHGAPRGQAHQGVRLTPAPRAAPDTP